MATYKKRISGTDYYTLEQVGEALGVTRERARQIEKIALKKLRANLKRQGLTLDDLIDDSAGPVTRNPFDRY